MNDEDLLLHLCGTFDPRECVSAKELAEELVKVKTYVFTDDSYYESPGCSCCDDYFVESFNCDQTSPNLGSASDEGECYLQAIATEKGWLFWESIPDQYREMSYFGLKKVADRMGIVVEIQGEAVG